MTMLLEEETTALRAVRNETVALEDLARTIFAAVTDDAKRPARSGVRMAAKVSPLTSPKQLKPVGT